MYLELGSVFAGSQLISLLLTGLVLVDSNSTSSSESDPEVELDVTTLAPGTGGSSRSVSALPMVS